jgi:NAD dependent epimerase/dehydratase family enzyme
MKILISGASGLVGSHLIPALEAKNHEIFRLVRKTPRETNEIQWDAEKGFSEKEQSRLENFDAVVHLAGDNVASENWSAEKKRKIRESRTVGTRVLVDALRKTQNPPKIRRRARVFSRKSATNGKKNRAARKNSARASSIRASASFWRKKTARWRKCSRLLNWASAAWSEADGNICRGSRSKIWCA